MSNISLKMNGKLFMDSITGIKEKKELAPYGKAQTVLDNEVARLCDPYVPFKTGMLKDSVNATDFGSGEVIYNAPYAKQQYYFGAIAKGKKARGRYWFERMKADHSDELLRTVRKVIKKG